VRKALAAIGAHIRLLRVILRLHIQYIRER
jgi:hypothetical protein